MKRVVCLLMALLLCAVSATAFAQQFKVKVTCTCSDYNHVGYNWTKEFKLNGKTLQSMVELKEGDTINLLAQITEKDKKPDVGETTVSRKISVKDLKKGFSVATEVVVKENAGRYVGCSAVWNIKYKFTPTKK